MPKGSEPEVPEPQSPYGPGVYQRGDKLYREVEIHYEGGSVRAQERQVARTLEQAQALRIDYYSSERGWFRDGYKWEKDQSAEAIMADGSQAQVLSVEEQERLREKAATGN